MYFDFITNQQYSKYTDWYFKYYLNMASKFNSLQCKNSFKNI